MFVKKQKNGKRLCIDDLINYIKINQNIIQEIGCVDLSKINNENNILITELLQLDFQNAQKINYLPFNLSQIFDFNQYNISKYIHLGILNKLDSFSDTFNISFYSSLFACLKNSFHVQQKQYQTSFITNFITKMIKNCDKKTFIKYNYEAFNWSISDILNDFKTNVVSEKVIKFISDYLHINIFILDLNNDLLFFGSGYQFIPYKKSIFLLKFDEKSYEPFYTEQSKHFSYSDKIISHIRKNPNCVSLFNLNNDFSFAELISDAKILYDDNINAYDEPEICDKEIETLSKSEKPKNIILNDIIKKKSTSIWKEKTDYDQDKLDKMKVVELKEICKKLNLDAKNKKKNELIELIKSKN